MAPTRTFEVPDHLRPFVKSAVFTSGLRLHYYEAGDPAAPPLVLVHGLADEADTWRRVILPLAERYRVIAPDLPGFGRSDRPLRPYTPPFLAHTLAALLSAAGAERAALVGHSLGAALALRVALARPELVERLALVAGGIRAPEGRIPAALLLFLTPGLGEALYTSLRRSEDAAYETLRPYYYDLDALPEEERAFLRRRVVTRVWSGGQRRAFLSTLRWTAVDTARRGAALRARLGDLRMPATIIWGDSDRISPPAEGEALAALIPDARLALVARCGHHPAQERPEELVSLL